MALIIEGLPTPIALRSAVTLTDEELLRFSSDNPDYRIERNAQGEIIVMSLVGGVGGAHEAYVIGELSFWSKLNGSGRCFSSASGFTLPDTSCLSPDVAWISHLRWNTLTLVQQTSFPPLCPDFVIEIRSATDPRETSQPKCSFGSRTEQSSRGLSTPSPPASPSTGPASPLKPSTTPYRSPQRHP